MKLSKDQQLVLDAMIEFANGSAGDLMTVGGFGGTGKSTVVGVFAAECRERGIRPAYVAPTGRAASVLRKKLTACGIQTTRTRGMPGVKQPPFCGTIHGLTKFPSVNPKGELVGFKSAPGLGGQYDLLVADEASMIGGEMRAHLQSFGLPILAVGDHGQLPPVNDTAGFMENPDFKLEKIHRQAADNPIIALSQAIRETGLMPKKLEDGVRLRFLNRRDGRKALAAQLLGSQAGAAGVSAFDQAIICAYNRTRVELNLFARDTLKLTTNPVYPKKGDLVMCLKNLHALGIMNGMRGVMLSNAEQSEVTPWQITGDMEFPDEELKISGDWLADRVGGMCWPGFMREKPFATVEDFNKEVRDFVSDLGDDDVGEEAATHMKDLGWPFDFGYAMTAHKSQGSQFSHVAVWIDRRVEPDSADYRRWLYTSATRATERLLVIE